MLIMFKICLMGLKLFYPILFTVKLFGSGKTGSRTVKSCGIKGYPTDYKVIMRVQMRTTQMDNL